MGHFIYVFFLLLIVAAGGLSPFREVPLYVTMLSIPVIILFSIWAMKPARDIKALAKTKGLRVGPYQNYIARYWLEVFLLIILPTATLVAMWVLRVLVYPRECIGTPPSP